MRNIVRNLLRKSNKCYRHKFFYNFVLQQCPSGQFCNLYNCGQMIDLAPGETCSSSANCWTQNCVSGTCSGNSTGYNCQSDLDCGVGLFCGTGGCTAQMAVGSTGCTAERMCVNSAGCVNSTCTSYLSLADGTNVVADTIAHLCTSGMSINGVCQDLYSSATESSYLTCTGTCTYNVGSATGTAATSATYCLCGYGSSGSKYCALGSTSVSAMAAKSWYQTNMSLMLKCHTAKRSNCNTIPYATRQAYLTDSSNLVGAFAGSSSCVQNFVFQAALSSSWISMNMLVFAISFFTLIFI